MCDNLGMQNFSDVAQGGVGKCAFFNGKLAISRKR